MLSPSLITEKCMSTFRPGDTARRLIQESIIGQTFLLQPVGRASMTLSSHSAQLRTTPQPKR
jgi:hypothetical protein